MIIQKFITKKERIIPLLYCMLFIFWLTILFPSIGIESYKNFYQVPITMIFGSFLGGFTCEGGGAVSFPVFTKLLHIEPSIARDFSFAIQSIGMSFASITILIRKVRVEKNVIKYATLSGLIGIAFGSYFVVPYVNASQVKLIFTLIVTSFGIALFIQNVFFKSKKYNEIPKFNINDKLILMSVGLVGGIFSSLIGTGIHFITFSIVTLLYKLDEKIATPTSIIIMACDSIFGFTFRFFVLGEFSNTSLLYWKMCIPIVAFFAPLGAIACSKVSRIFIIKVLLTLVSIEFITTLILYKFTFNTTFISVVVIIISLIFYISLAKASNRILYEEPNQ